MPCGAFIDIGFGIAEIVLTALVSPRSPKLIANVSEFHFSYSTGAMRDSCYNHATKTTGDNVVVTIRHNNEPKECF